MLRFLLLTFAVVSCQEYDSANNQLPIFKEKHPGPIGIMTTSAGAPIEERYTKSTLNTDMLRNDYFIESMMHLNRKNRPERYMHAKGAGAFGHFETTHDISHICKADLFSKVGKKTPVAVRFSSSLTEKSSIDTGAGLDRGFAVRYYTAEGNFDILGTNSPIFPVKDPVWFSGASHALRRNPTTHLFDQNVFWDFTTRHPESLHSLLFKMSDRGIPDGYRHMEGHSVQTYEVYNKKGENFFVRFYYKPEAGIKNLLPTKAAEIGVRDPDYATRDMYNAIANGTFPAWQLSIQVLTPQDVKKARKTGLDVCDVTKEIPIKKYKLHPVGRLVLNKNPTNYFAEVEQMAMNPANVVPGVMGCCGKLYEARCMTYRMAQSYRLGSNFNNIAVNCPFQKPANSYNRDGVSPISKNIGEMPDYAYNSFNGPQPTCEKNRPKMTQIFEDEPDNCKETGEFYLSLSQEERDSIDEALIKSLCQVTEEEVQNRAVEVFTKTNADLGNRLAEGLENCC